MAPIRVLIVDDHTMVRCGLRNLLSSYEDIRVAGIAKDGESALRTVAELTPDIVLLDIQLGLSDGITVASQLHKQNPGTKVIVLTAYDNDDYVEGALRAGAQGYLLKSSPAPILVDAIRLVNQGKRIVSPNLMDRVLEQFQELAQVKAKYQSGLTDEDLQVLTMIAQGATNEQIARDMCWAQRTLGRKVDEIIAKMGARSRAQAVCEGIKKGLI